MYYNRLCCVAVSLAVFGSVCAVGGATPEPKSLEQENTQLRNRVDKLETELSQIKALLADKGLPVPGAPIKPAVRSGLNLELYGYIKLDAAFDDSRVSAGNFARWVESEMILNDDSQFSLTANQTRLGMNILGPDVGQVTTGGKVEIDFYGGGSENKSNPMLRHAYATFGWPDKNLSVLAGQTSDIISPLVMPTINYSAGWWQGNIGYRRAQLRLTKEIDLSEQTSLKLELGPTRTIADTFVTGPDAGADAAVPTVQGRASVTLPLCGQKPATFGVSGHWGREDQHITDVNTNIIGHAHVDSWSINLDAKLPVTDWLVLQAEAFYGKGLAAYLGNIGQAGEITGMGGWAAATITPCKNWQFNLGAGVDNPDNDDLAKASDRSINWVAFGNATYFLTSNLSLALELMYLETDYLGQQSGDAFRQQAAVTFKF